MLLRGITGEPRRPYTAAGCGCGEGVEAGCEGKGSAVRRRFRAGVYGRLRVPCFQDGEPAAVLDFHQLAVEQDDVVHPPGVEEYRGDPADIGGRARRRLVQLNAASQQVGGEGGANHEAPLGKDTTEGDRYLSTSRRTVTSQ